MWDYRHQAGAEGDGRWAWAVAAWEDSSYVSHQDLSSYAVCLSVDLFFVIKLKSGRCLALVQAWLKAILYSALKM